MREREQHNAKCHALLIEPTSVRGAISRSSFIPSGGEESTCTGELPRVEPLPKIGNVGDLMES